MERHKIGIVIPALNESETIGRIVRDSKKYGIPIVVNDGSNDQTEEISIESGAHIVNHKFTRGYDASLNSGFNYAISLGCMIIVTLDADGEHNPLDIEHLINEIESGADLVVGIRNGFQRISEHLYSFYTRIFYGIKDPLCGFKAYRINIYKKLGHFDSYSSIGTELTLYAAKNKYKISQIKIHSKKRQNKSRFGNIFVGNLKIMRAMVLSFFIK